MQVAREGAFDFPLPINLSPHSSVSDIVRTSDEYTLGGTDFELAIKYGKCQIRIVSSKEALIRVSPESFRHVT